MLYIFNFLILFSGLTRSAEEQFLYFPMHFTWEYQINNDVVALRNSQLCGLNSENGSQYSQIEGYENYYGSSTHFSGCLYWQGQVLPPTYGCDGIQPDSLNDQQNNISVSDTNILDTNILDMDVANQNFPNYNPTETQHTAYYNCQKEHYMHASHLLDKLNNNIDIFDIPCEKCTKIISYMSIVNYIKDVAINYVGELSVDSIQHQLASKLLRAILPKTGSVLFIFTLNIDNMLDLKKMVVFCARVQNYLENSTLEDVLKRDENIENLKNEMYDIIIRTAKHKNKNYKEDEDIKSLITASPEANFGYNIYFLYHKFISFMKKTEDCPVQSYAEPAISDTKNIDMYFAFIKNSKSIFKSIFINANILYAICNPNFTVREVFKYITPYVVSDSFETGEVLRRYVNEYYSKFREAEKSNKLILESVIYSSYVPAQRSYIAYIDIYLESKHNNLCSICDFLEKTVKHLVLNCKEAFPELYIRSISKIYHFLELLTKKYKSPVFNIDDFLKLKLLISELSKLELNELNEIVYGLKFFLMCYATERLNPEKIIIQAITQKISNKDENEIIQNLEKYFEIFECSYLDFDALQIFTYLSFITKTRDACIVLFSLFIKHGLVDPDDTDKPCYDFMFNHGFHANFLRSIVLFLLDNVIEIKNKMQNTAITPGIYNTPIRIRRFPPNHTNNQVAKEDENVAYLKKMMKAYQSMMDQSKDLFKNAILNGNGKNDCAMTIYALTDYYNAILMDIANNPCNNPCVSDTNASIIGFIKSNIDDLYVKQVELPTSSYSMITRLLFEQFDTKLPEYFNYLNVTSVRMFHRVIEDDECSVEYKELFVRSLIRYILERNSYILSIYEVFLLENNIYCDILMKNYSYVNIYRLLGELSDNKNSPCNIENSVARKQFYEFISSCKVKIKKDGISVDCVGYSRNMYRSVITFLVEMGYNSTNVPVPVMRLVYIFIHKTLVKSCTKEVSYGYNIHDTYKLQLFTLQLILSDKS